MKEIKKDDLIDLFFNGTTLRIFLNIEGEEYTAKIRNKVGCMYSYVSTRLKEFEKLGLVEHKKEGRIKRYKLTEKGRILKQKLEDLLE